MIVRLVTDKGRLTVDMQPARYPSESESYFYVYYTKREGQWAIEAVHPEGEKRPAVYTSRSVIAAVDELGAFQKVNTWLQKSNAELAKQAAL